ncbi:MAG: glycine dehydrogenase (aminomethyl-transferring), partial [Gemmatimonadetes bacterium]|nr:glycine dehydrogenase (aminomethyl-transferring) [Gemmatimonadota bacterium]NIU77557.1 glycine dehydrogenase (aminomethyl-transferring) [Gammaproteobacteria bacterium]NIV57470.1 glycine dehydrogenase (aminomethyl-transferring) [Actinomycetota bacterium]NIQ57392.1 glycine dehydrogenase (aminomethyl-transferring) [Gemmatimonadota bacterium]NIV88995.1 glycine dehydrogenase (aminomethyl-transferring) [Actinomycetota bacterium]
EGIRRIAERIRALTGVLAAGLERLGHDVLTEVFFDTVRVRPVGRTEDFLASARDRGINLRDFGDGTVGIALDEVTRPEDVDDLLAIFNGGEAPDFSAHALDDDAPPPELPEWAARTSAYLEHEVFNRYHSETEMLRYLHKLESR